ncbi:hypothetical protein BLNAU_16472 [Blattamonas nauphoetae]|uniref:Uncharacterized protein n=1 Tax=Blattamonas nauphoetae TaxID=2049346 RepID=A0ABQ9XBD7_9EUKA|nr:hypothetical protein BLNAU_16472 [Blattamonas nauphoetae]
MVLYYLTLFAHLNCVPDPVTFYVMARSVGQECKKPTREDGCHSLDTVAGMGRWGDVVGIEVVGLGEIVDEITFDGSKITSPADQNVRKLPLKAQSGTATIAGTGTIIVTGKPNNVLDLVISDLRFESTRTPQSDGKQRDYFLCILEYGVVEWTNSYFVPPKLKWSPFKALKTFGKPNRWSSKQAAIHVINGSLKTDNNFINHDISIGAIYADNPRLPYTVPPLHDFDIQTHRTALLNPFNTRLAMLKCKSKIGSYIQIEGVKEPDLPPYQIHVDSSGCNIIHSGPTEQLLWNSQNRESKVIQVFDPILFVNDLPIVHALDVRETENSFDSTPNSIFARVKGFNLFPISAKNVQVHFAKLQGTKRLEDYKWKKANLYEGPISIFLFRDRDMVYPAADGGSLSAAIKINKMGWNDGMYAVRVTNGDDVFYKVYKHGDK